MAKPRTWGLVLAATAFSTHAFAQAPVEVNASQSAEATLASTREPAAANSVDVSMPGGIPGVVVVGRRERDVQRETTQVITVLSQDDIARTGEGDIAGALGRVTGLSVVGGGFVYVRGLGDRYSLALLNGSPLPSPEPMRRAVPLNLFPTDVVASSLVQKTYSPNFPGEFGGGVINLTTLAIPTAPFLDVNLGVSGDTETTGQLGYDYYGNKRDWTGYGNRDTPAALAEFFASGQRLSSGTVDSGAIAGQLVSRSNGLVQTVGEIPANFSGKITAGDAWQFDESELGVIATAGFSNGWRTRDNIEQTPASFDLSGLDHDYRKVSTENQAVANALLGLGYEFGEGHTLRWTNLYIHDTLKRTSLAEGKQNSQALGQDFREQTTALYERELLSTQLTGGFNLDPVKVSTRASYSTSKREAPYELGIGYVRTNQAASPYGGYFINRLDNGQSGFAEIAFSDLQEDLWSAGVDLTAQLMPRLVLSGGLDIADTQRDSTRRAFQIVAPSSFPSGVGMLRPDYLLSAGIIDFYDIGLVETTETDPAFAARLRTEAAYAQVQAEVAVGLELSVGARYEQGEQDVRPLQVFDTLTNSGASTNIANDYLLPAATLTYRFRDDMQMRLHASKTVARPQFRELMFQRYYDPEANRTYRGNPLLTDSEFVNAEARYEWYFAPEQRFSVAGFYKEIDQPIETFTGFNDNTTETSFANAPQAVLYGAELEVQKYFPLDERFGSGILGSRRAVVIANYTYTNSQINVEAGDTVSVFGTATQPASHFFVDGSPLTGQSDHIVNLQFGLESPGRLSQQTILLSYASDRVTSRGPSGMPDFYESTGLRVDLVAREALRLFNTDMEFKLEARNIFGEGYEEFQERGENTVYYNRYDVGTTISASVTVAF
ncbi:TonB-dependent receptor domain-containing protein [Povalibacter sp.]|uniref:TonB-dependent receptor domain-containing protein n=1 Tax=Povalibacter sp. TaxID=1962978 RepID=UPI002F4154C0